MARVNISVPDELHEAAKACGLSVSAVCQDALREAVALAQGDDSPHALIGRIETLLGQLRAKA
jgi:hypothetical protein